MTSPVFVATFADGELTRMTTHHEPDRKSFDLARGIRLARAAYESRTGRTAPAITKAHFKRDGVTLKKELNEAQTGEQP